MAGRSRCSRSGCPRGRTPRLRCLAELNTTWDGGARTALNLGAVQSLGPHLNLLASAGTEVTGPAAERAHLLFYLGAQLLL